MANVKTNAYGQTYSGNDDFRGWLAAGNAEGKIPISGLTISDTEWALRNFGNDRSADNPIGQQLYDEWQSGRTGTTGGSSGSSSSSSSSGSSSSSSYDAAMVDFYNQLIAQNHNKLNAMGNTLDNLNKSTENEYQTKKNELQSSYNENYNTYDTGTKQNQQNLQTSKNNIADNASQGLRGLLRTLGAMGAGGSSAALYAAPEAVTTQANQELAGANQESAQNQQNLDTNWNNYLADYDNDKKKLEDYRTAQLRENEQEVLEQKNSILNEILSALANRGAYGGGRALSEMQDLTNQIQSNTNRYNELNNFVKPTYEGITASYEAPALSTYNTGQTDLTTKVTSGGENTTPLLAMLLGVNARKEAEEAQ